MSTPPRRRRPRAAGSSSGSSTGWLPTIAMGLGVVVAGLGIGALVAVFMQRGSDKAGPPPAPVAVVTSTPGAAAPVTRPPIAIATIEPPRTPRPAPTLPPSPSPAPADSPSPSPAAATDAPSPAPTAEVTLPPSAVPAAAATPVRAAVVARAPVRTATPHELPNDTPEPTEAPATPDQSPSAAPSPSPASTYDEHAEAVVRRYVDALVRGDEKTAYAALGGTGGTLSEQNFIDSSARIISMKVTRIDASNASVGCEIVSAKGHYYATYHVTAATSGPYISEHDYIKV